MNTEDQDDVKTIEEIHQGLHGFLFNYARLHSIASPGDMISALMVEIRIITLSYSELHPDLRYAEYVSQSLHAFASSLAESEEEETAQPIIH